VASMLPGDSSIADVVAYEAMAPPGTASKKRSQAAIVWRRFCRDRMALLGGGIIVVAILLAALAPLIAPHDPLHIEGTKRLAKPGISGHLLGTDEAGRDILSRLIYGGRVSLVVALVPVMAAAAVSIFIGLAAGYFGGLVEQAIMRPLDVFFAFPRIILAIALAAALGSGMISVMLALMIGLIPYITRVAYSAVRAAKNLPYVDAARSCGAREWQIVVHEILPNILAPVIVYCTTLTGLMIILAAGLSFLGVGVKPPTPDWGIMLDGGRRVLTVAPHVATIPGLVILILSVAFNLLGDGLRDALDPRLRTPLD
jgi:ABC-type dipeptide/oligopeptide/nickel transport system permease subunit